MNKSLIHPHPGYFQRYIDLVSEADLFNAFSAARRQLDELNLDRLKAVGLKTYAPSKWTIPDIMQHLLDAERIMAYRALRFARKDQTPLTGYDDDAYAEAAKSTRQSVEVLIHSWKILRQSNQLLFESFDQDALLRTGTANNQEISVGAIGFMIIGHQYHHLGVISDKYLNLID